MVVWVVELEALLEKLVQLLLVLLQVPHKLYLVFKKFLELNYLLLKHVFLV